MKRRRVKITGLGPVTPAGIGKEAFWNGLNQNASQVRTFNKFGSRYGPLVAAQIENFNIRDYIDASAVPNGAARHTLFAIAGAVLAVKDAALTAAELKSASCAIIVGAALMDFGAINNSIQSVDRLGARGIRPRTIYTFNTASISGSVNDVLGITARTMAVQSSCCSGGDAIGFAAELVGNGEVDMAICGGTEAPLYQFPLLELREAGLTPTNNEMPEKINRPFDLWRTTGVVSEGACMVVIEPESSPRPGYSFISGYAFDNDPPDQLCNGMVAASRMALADARLRPSDIEVLNAWGPGHRLIDAAECRAMDAVFGRLLPDLPATSIKGVIGNPLAAAPAIQVAATAMAQRKGVIPPTINWEFPDPACALNLSRQARSIDHRVTMINAHGLAGVNSSLILERC